MKCILASNGEEIASEVELAKTYFTRLKGLMFRKGFPDKKALLLEPCPQIHTCFMRFTIDAVFCDKTGRVLYVAEKMKPWRFSKFVRGAKYTLEFNGGYLNHRIKKDDLLLLK